MFSYLITWEKRVINGSYNSAVQTRGAIFTVNEVQKFLIEHGQNHLQKETRFWRKNVDGNLLGRN